MKIITAKLKKSTILKKVIAGILTSSIALFSAMPVYAGTTVDQETLYPILRNSTVQYLYPTTGSTKTIYRLTNIGDILAQFADQSTLNQKSIYTLMNTISGYVDGIEGYIDGIEGYVDGIEGKIDTSNTHLNAIKGYVDTLETLVTTSNTHLNAIKGYVDGIEGKIDTSNTRLNDIKSAIQNITTYNYTQVLSDILTNTGYLSTIDTYTQSIQDSIGYGTSVSNLQTKTDSIANWTSQSNTKLGVISDKLSILDDNYTPQSLISILRRRYTASNMYPSAEPYTTNFNPLNVTYVTSNADNQYTIESVGTGAKRSIYTMLGYTNTNIVSLFSAIQTLGTTYRVQKIDYTDGVPEYDTDGNGWNYTYSIADQLHFMNVNMASFFSRMGYVLADDNTISAKQANQAQEQSALTNFTGQGNASASASDFGQLSGAVTSVKSGLNTNASPSDVLGVFNSTDGFGWFSQATLNALDTTTQTRGAKAVSDTPLYDSNYNAIMEYLTGSDRK